jgi:hypothetical protein
VLLVGGCAGQPDESSTAAQATTSTVAPTTLAPTTTAPPPLTAKERAWLKAIPRVSGKIEKAVGGVDHHRHTRNDACVCEHAAKLPS